MVSISTKSPGITTSGRGKEMCRFFHGEYFLVRLYRSKTLWTVLSPTAMPRASSVFQITCPHRPCFLRSFTMSASIDFGIAFGCVCGADESVGIPALPLYGARAIHFEMVPGETPTYRAASRTPHHFNRT